MRNALKPYENIRFTFIATFEKYGTSLISNIRYDTVLLKDLTNLYGDFLADHIWIREANKFKKIKIKAGDKIIFSAVVKKYKRGYYKIQNEDFDYKLIYLEKIKIIS